MTETTFMLIKMVFYLQRESMTIMPIVFTLHGTRRGEGNLAILNHSINDFNLVIFRFVFRNWFYIKYAFADDMDYDLHISDCCYFYCR